VVTRYGREWRMGQWTRSSSVLLGRIGFQAAGDVAELWDHNLNDFRPQRLVTGTTAPFAINTRSLRLAFQIRPGLIERGSFVGALRTLMNESYGRDRWRVESDFHHVEWKSWVQQTSRITRLEIRLERPNPNYHGREHVEELIESVEADLLKLTFEARPDDPDGLNLSDEVIMEMIDHAAEHGSWRASGEIERDGETRKAQWRSDVEGVAPELRTEADPTTKEVLPDDLRSRVAEQPDVGSRDDR
jgi:hypothetical protein